MNAMRLARRLAYFALAAAGAGCGLGSRGGSGGPALVVPAPAAVVIAPTSTAASLRGALPVSLSDGSAATWSIEPSSVPSYLKLARLSGTTGVDPISYEVDVAEAPQGRVSVFELSVGVSRTDVPPLRVRFSVDERLPRLGAAYPLVLDVGQRFPYLYLSGSFTEDIVANGMLEVSGATVLGAEIERPAGTHVVVALKDVTAGVPITARLNYGLLRTTATVQVVAREVPPGYFAALPFEVRRPPVYSMSQQAYFYISGGSVRRLALQGGAWVESARALTDPLDLDLARRDAALIVMTREGMIELDATSLEVVRAPLLGFQSRPLASWFWSSWNKHLVVSMADRMWWSDVDVGCGSAPRTAALSDPSNESPGPLQIECNGTNSGFGLLAGGDRNIVLFFKNDASADYQYWDTVSGNARESRFPVGNPRGLVATTYRGGPFVPWGGGFSLGFAGVEVRRVEWAPAGYTIGAYGMGPSDDYALSYAYVVDAGTQGPQASAPTLFLVKSDISQPAPLPGIPIALAQPLGCLSGRPVDEPCEHRAHIMVDPANRHAMILGPQGVAIVPFPAGTFPLQ